MRKRKKQKGLSLIELLISMSIGLIIVSLLIEIYLANQHSIQLQMALYAIQDNAKSAIHILKSEMQQAGLIGCAKLTENFPIISHVDQTLNANNKFVYTNKEITVRYAEYTNTFLVKDMHDNVTLFVSKDDDFKANNIILISDCRKAEIIKIKKVYANKYRQKIILYSPLHYRYKKFSEVSHLAINRYYIEKTKRKYNNGKDIYALFVRDIHEQKNELIPNIQDMKITHLDNKGINIAIDIYTPPFKKTWYMYEAIPD